MLVGPGPKAVLPCPEISCQLSVRVRGSVSPGNRSLRGRGQYQAAVQTAPHSDLLNLDSAPDPAGARVLGCYQGLSLQEIWVETECFSASLLTVQDFFSLSFTKSAITYPLLSTCKIVLLLSVVCIYLFYHLFIIVFVQYEDKGN